MHEICVFVACLDLVYLATAVFSNWHLCDVHMEMVLMKDLNALFCYCVILVLTTKSKIIFSRIDMMY